MGIEITDVHINNIGWALGTVVFIIISSLAVGLIARFVAKLLRATPQEQRRVFWGFSFAGPWIVGFLIFVVGPALASLLYSFTRYKIGQDFDFLHYEDYWEGLRNYRTLLLGEGRYGRRFKEALFNSFYYTIIGVPLQILASLGMAILLNRAMRGIRVFRTIFYLPVILAASPAALLAWRYMFTSNGGFVNNTLQWLAESFFIFDYLYRFFIYSVESFNGFYAGVAKGDPVGPLKYTLPALIGVLVLLTLLGDWDKGKKARAQQVAEVLSIVVVGNMISTGLVRVPVNISWTYFSGIIFGTLILINAWQDKASNVRLWQVIGVILFGISFYLTLQRADFSFSNGLTQKYLIVMAIAALPLAYSMYGQWDTRKYRVTGAMLGVLGLLIFVRAVLGDFDYSNLKMLSLRLTDGGWRMIPTYLTFGSTIEYPSDLDYLKEIYPAALISASWIYALVIGVLVGLIVLGERYSRARRYLLYSGLVFFALFTVSSYLDGRAYFNAFVQIAEDTGRPHYHFVLFRQAAEVFPDTSRVPLWMDNNLWSKPSLVLITVWSSGASMLIFLAALKGVPPVLYEAAEVDGANTVQKFFKITLPMISPAMFYNIVIGVIAALQTFESIYILRTPNSESSLASAAYFLYTRTFVDLAIGEGASASWILAMIILTLTVLQFRYSRWVNYEV